MRDARIAQIYEGTNAIQALDLVGRKLSLHGGRLIRRFFEMVKADIDRYAAEDHMKEFVAPVAASLSQLQKATMFLAERGHANPDEVGAAATEYLHLLGYVAVGWQWLHMASVAQAQLAANTGDARFLNAKVKTARFFCARVLPESAALLSAIQAGASAIMAMHADEF